MNVNKMMFLLALLAMTGSTIAQEFGNVDDFDALVEEEVFWGRELQASISMSIPVTPPTPATPSPRPPTRPAPTDAEPTDAPVSAPTLAPVTPPTPAPVVAPTPREPTESTPTDAPPTVSI